MTGQILEISTDHKYLSASDGFILVSEKEKELARMPIDSVEAVIVSAHGVTYSNHLLVRLSECHIPFVICNQKHFPVSFLLPLSGHYKQGAVMDAQAQASVSLNKSLWKEIVKTKIKMQIGVLEYLGKPTIRLDYLLKHVKSDDKENAEGQAARVYFQTLFGADFVRDRDAEGINLMLNYGYTVLRAFVARYVVAAGLHPTLGIHHSNMLNSFRLSDDLMEPFRPLIDCVVWHLFQKGEKSLSPLVKRKLVQIFSKNLPTCLGQTQISIAVQNLCISLAKVYLNEKKSLDFPFSLQKRDWDELNAGDPL